MAHDCLVEVHFILFPNSRCFKELVGSELEAALAYTHLNSLAFPEV